MPGLFWIGIVVGLAQAGPPEPPSSPAPTTLRASSPTPVDEVVVTAPKPTKIEERKYEVVPGVRGRELDAEAARKAPIVRYRDNIYAPYPGLNCVFRSKGCPN